LHGGHGGSRGERSCVGEPVQQEFQAKEVVAVGMGDVNGCEMLADLGKPIDQFLRMLY